MSVPAGADARLLAGELAVIPTDTVYGIACAAPYAEACARLYALKDRPPDQPTALIFGSVGGAESAIPELAGAIVRAARPGDAGAGDADRPQPRRGGSPTSAARRPR